MLRVRNQGVGPALQLITRPGRPPLSVNSKARVANLNADMVDGKHASAFMESGSSAGGSLTGSYPNPGISAGAVGANQIASGAVGTSQIADGSIGNAKLLPNAVGTNNIADNAVSGSKIANGAVGSSEIAFGAVDSSRIANGAVGSSKIASSAVGTGQINNTQVQQRVSGICPSGSSIRSISQTGTVVCESDGVTGREVVENSSAFNNSTQKSATATCPSGKIAISGGGWYSKSATTLSRNSADEIALQGSRPVFADRWAADADWMEGGAPPFDWRVIAYAVCVNQ
jgi:hypothetical protein